VWVASRHNRKTKNCLAALGLPSLSPLSPRARLHTHQRTHAQRQQRHARAQPQRQRASSNAIPQPLRTTSARALQHAAVETGTLSLLTRRRADGACTALMRWYQCADALAGTRPPSKERQCSRWHLADALARFAASVEEAQCSAHPPRCFRRSSGALLALCCWIQRRCSSRRLHECTQHTPTVTRASLCAYCGMLALALAPRGISARAAAKATLCCRHAQHRHGHGLTAVVGLVARFILPLPLQAAAHQSIILFPSSLPRNLFSSRLPSPRHREPTPPTPPLTPSFSYCVPQWGFATL
jgi:hypothetical protein